MSSSKVDCVTVSSEIELWAPSQAFKVGEIITLSGGGEWSKFGAASVDPKLDESYDDSVRYEPIPEPMFVVTAVKEGRVQARQCSLGDMHDHYR